MMHAKVTRPLEQRDMFQGSMKINQSLPIKRKITSTPDTV